MAKLYSMGQWFAQQLTRQYEPEVEEQERERYTCNSFVLFHVKNGTIEEEIHTQALGSKKWEASTLASRFDDMAATHASGIPGRQQYFIKAVFNDDSIISPKFTFGKAGESQDIGIGTEGPSQQGFMGQMMRHVETYARIMTIHTEQMFKMQSEANEQLQEQNKRLTDENVEAFKAIKEMVIEQTKNEHNGQAELLEYERRTKQQQFLLSLAPGLLNKLLGKEIIPQGSMAESAIAQLKATIEPEQIAKIAEILKPEQMVPILQLIAPENGENK
jgi:hypothetical protein